MKASILILFIVLGLFVFALTGCQTSEQTPSKITGWQMTPSGVEVPLYSQTQ